MGFSTSSKNIHLRNIPNNGDGLHITNLCAECKDDKGNWHYREITLDWHIGVDTPTGRFLLDSLHITNHASKLELTAGGAVLICTMNAFYNHRVNILALDMIFHNDGGDLVYQLPPRNVRSRLTHLTLRPMAVLQGFAFTRYGTLCPTSLDLDDHLGNENGILKPKKNGNFSHSAYDLCLDGSWTLCCLLEDWHRNLNSISCWELMENWVSITDEGQLVMQDPAGTWDLRGPFFRLLEDIPIIGYVVAGIDELEGDHNEAIRAAAECTYATICLAAALVGGALLGPVGAAVASGVAGYAGMYAKQAIGKHIGDPKMRNEVTAITIYRVLVAELTMIAGVGLGEVSGAFVDLLSDELMASGLEALASDMAKWLGKKALKKLAKKDLEIIVKNLVDAIQHGKSEDDIKHMFGDWDNDGVDLLNDPTPPPPPPPRPRPPIDEDTNAEAGCEGIVTPRDPPYDPTQDPEVDFGHIGWDESGGGTGLQRQKRKRDRMCHHGGILASTPGGAIQPRAQIAPGIHPTTASTPAHTLSLNGDSLTIPDSWAQECLFRLDMTRLLAGGHSDANTNINFYADDGYTLRLHISFRPATQNLHLSQWWDGSWRSAWWAPFDEVFADMEAGQAGWLRVSREAAVKYQFETFQLGKNNEPVHGASWTVHAPAKTVECVRFEGSAGLLGGSLDVWL
ncbi:uncharacterized protein BO97DRAFT_478467 [Aspergillus homomorphus CBS 101889]|uniref:Cyanovirin-N domain-containing protein n=1 Tax=Aspergillus homomorphus (strain CBS 101889) TaxID=1450537 RepID=A0A395HTY8_ASPHC|nr:hypothetical protein BO97DRAFT_478467 [Aspergillus homomorphus CBS 101889]RAL11422.1 hypothetical protein BO97DRAFT_478467 [Aspergillus homomorphus CBS 101889]